MSCRGKLVTALGNWEKIILTLRFRSMYLPIQERCCTTINSGQQPHEEAPKPPPTVSKSVERSHSKKIGIFFRTNPHLFKVKDDIPKKYLSIKRRSPPVSLYLIDEQVAKDVVSVILPNLEQNDHQIIGETNGGLGLIGRELLNSGIQLVRFYESCPNFRANLQDYRDCYPSRVEVFNKDLFLLPRFEYMDKQDHGSRVDQLLKGVPKKSWSDDPSLTVLGSMPNLNFLKFLVRSLILQHSVISYGRFQFYAFMRPKDYVITTAGPHLNLHTYQNWSIIANLFLEINLLRKYPRNVFLPWESVKKTKSIRYVNKIDPELIYLVQINFKKDLPVKSEQLLALYYFITQFFGRGTTKVIPTLEKWVPGSGLNAMIPKLKHDGYYQNLDIFTQFGDLNPNQILYVYKEMVNHPEYEKSPFLVMIESQLLKTETIETSLDDQLEHNIVKDLEVRIEDER